MEAPISPRIGLENVSLERFRNSISPTRKGISPSKRLELKSMNALKATFMIRLDWGGGRVSRVDLVQN